MQPAVASLRCGLWPEAAGPDRCARCRTQLWFSRVLCDGFATAASDSRAFVPFNSIAEFHLYDMLGCGPNTGSREAALSSAGASLHSTDSFVLGSVTERKIGTRGLLCCCTHHL